MRILSIQKPPRKRHYEVTLEGGDLVSLSGEVLATSGLRTGQDVSEARLDEVRRAEAHHRAMSGALRLLAYRPRTERELRDALRRRATSDEVVAETLGRLRALGLIDDVAFARAYVDVRAHSSPRAARLLAAELAAKGVARPDREESLAGHDDAEAAYRAGARKARTLASADFPTFQRRLGDHLLRRGFDFATARDTVRTLWDEQRAGAEDAGGVVTPPEGG